MNTTIQSKPPTKPPIAYSVHAALDLHCRQSLLGSMDHDGNWLGQSRFATDAEHLTAAVRALGGPGAGVCLTLEASSLTRWAAGLVRPLVDRLVICEPRHNRLINQNPNKNDEKDIEGMCLLLRVHKLHEVWMGEDRPRQIHRELVYELLNWRDAQRELKALIKARYRQWGVLRVEGTAVFSKTGREAYLSQLPGGEERRMLLRVHAQHDHAIGQWKDTLREVRRAGGPFWEVGEFKKIPGIGVIGAHVFSAIIEDPARFGARQQLMSYARLSITERSSDGKPLGYQRLDRRGHRELKTLSYHAWRTACRSTTRTNALQRFHDASLERTHDVRHARLNTQRKLLTAMWRMWLRREPWDPARFFPTTDPKAKASGRSETEDAGG
jgi:transposase